MIPVAKKIFLENNRICLLLIGLSAILFYWFVNPASLYFLNDDFDSMPDYFNGQLIEHGGMRMTPELTWILSTHVCGANPLGYLVGNLMIHIGVCFLFYGWFKSVAKSLQVLISNGIALAVTVLFNWYAFHSEAVTWNICRTASMSLLFFLSSWLLVMAGLKNRLFLWLSLPCFVLGMFSYENCWLYPLSLSVWWALLPETSEYRNRKIGVVVIASWVVLAAYFPVRRYLAAHWIDSYLAENVLKLDLMLYAKNAFALFTRSFLPPMENKIVMVLLSVGIGVGLFLLSVYLWKQKKIDRLWWLLLFNWAFSYVFFVTMGVDTNGYESERYLYFPSLFLCAWLVYSIYLLRLNRNITVVLFMVFLGYHVLFLSKALHAFRQAGGLAKAAIELVWDDKTAKTIEIENLPTKSFGIPIFRFGFNKGVLWMNPNADTAKIMVRSKAIFTWKQQVAFTDSLNEQTGVRSIKFYATQGEEPKR